MAQIVLTIPDAVLPRVIDALCIDGQRPATSPVPKGQFAKQQIIDHVMRVVRQVEAQQAAEAARATADAAAATDVVIT
jgi:hypothetical protein